MAYSNFSRTSDIWSWSNGEPESFVIHVAFKDQLGNEYPMDLAGTYHEVDTAKEALIIISRAKAQGFNVPNELIYKLKARIKHAK
jgi:hypothetical protein